MNDLKKLLEAVLASGKIDKSGVTFLLSKTKEAAKELKKVDTLLSQISKKNSQLSVNQLATIGQSALGSTSPGISSLAEDAEKAADSWENSMDRISNSWTDTVENISDSTSVVDSINNFKEILKTINNATNHADSSKSSWSSDFTEKILSEIKNVGIGMLVAY